MCNIRLFLSILIDIFLTMKKCVVSYIKDANEKVSILIFFFLFQSVVTMSAVHMDNKTAVFNPLEASKYLESLQKNQKLMTLIRYNHQFDWSKSEGLQQDEVKKLISRCHDSQLKKLYGLALETLTDNDPSTLLVSNDDSDNVSKSNISRKSYVLYAEKQNDKYNIVTGNAIQTKEIDWGKAATIGFTASLATAGIGCGLGALAGFSIGPLGSLVGSVVGGSVGGIVGASGVASKVYADYHEIMPKAVYAYILQELQEKQAISIDDNKFILYHQQN